MIQRTFDATAINAIANHPAIKPWVSPSADYELDLSEPVADPRNVALRGTYGAMIYHLLQPSIFEVHTLVKPEGRGAWTLSFVRECLHWMFTRTHALEIMTRCPRGNLAARTLAKSVHLVYQFTNPSGWIRDGEPISTDIFALSIQDWIRTAPGLETYANWFRERLDAEFAAQGHAVPQHPYGNANDRYIGAAAAMMLGGQLDKAAIFYNRFAAMAGYASMSIVSHDPVTIDIGNALVVLSGEDPSETLH